MSHSILVIEDQDADFEVIERGLRRVGIEYPVIRCTDTEEALDYLYGRGDHRHEPGWMPPTIVLLDLRLDGGDGREVLVRMKQDDFLKAIPIIVWSGSTDPKDVEISYRLGANSFVRKTFDFSEVQRTLERLALFWLETAVLPPRTNVRGED